jgi:hypothetical protein
MQSIGTYDKGNVFVYRLDSIGNTVYDFVERTLYYNLGDAGITAYDLEERSLYHNFEGADIKWHAMGRAEKLCYL